MGKLSTTELQWRLTVSEVWSQVKVVQREGYVAADLGGEVGIESKPLQMYAQHLERGREVREW